jgi:hypothetical protein
LVVASAAGVVRVVALWLVSIMVVVVVGEEMTDVGELRLVLSGEMVLLGSAVFLVLLVVLGLFTAERGVLPPLADKGEVLTMMTLGDFKK